ncbi:unnamed protein product [marine sediment metagenome]|uniref:Uncharacterized protein n=1 Tax=marine sediment metagenome TaxID=412755 RepID=X1GLZ9_9ZZZZ
MGYSLKMMSECDFYTNLYDDYIETRNDENERFLWKTRKIIDLMKVTTEKDTNGFMENGLRMIMLLFKQFRINSCDLCSIDLIDTPFNEKEELILILQAEFT